MTIIMTLFALSNTTLIVEDINNNNGFAEIALEDVDITYSYNTILHIIDPREIQNIIEELEENTKVILDKNDKHFLNMELLKAKSKLQTIIPTRHPRGLINFVGTGMKWLYGTMDDFDRTEIERHLHTIDNNNHAVIENLNKNIEINYIFNETVSKLKDAIESDRTQINSKLNQITKNDEELENKLIYLDLLLKIKILLDNIEHIQNNLVAAKTNTINNNVLTSEEIARYNIDLYKMQNTKLSAAQYKENKIIFVIQIPKDIRKIKRSFFIPIPNENQEELIFKNKEILKINNTMYDFTNEVKRSNLKKSNLCIFTNNCLRKKNKQIETVEIKPGLIILKNHVNSIINSTCNNRQFNLNGNKLITFNDCKIEINGDLYCNFDDKFEQHFLINNNFNISNITSQLTFDEIISNQIKNIQKIEELKFHKKYNYTFNGLALIFSLLALGIVVIFCIYKKIKKNKIKIIEKTQESFQSNGEGVMSTSHSNNSTYSLPVNWQQ